MQDKKTALDEIAKMIMKGGDTLVLRKNWMDGCEIIALDTSNNDVIAIGVTIEEYDGDDIGWVGVDMYPGKVFKNRLKTDEEKASEDGDAVKGLLVFLASNKEYARYGFRIDHISVVIKDDKAAIEWEKDRHGGN